VGEQPGVFRRNPVGASNGSAMARHAEAVPERQHLLATPADVGGRRRLGRCLAGSSRDARRTRLPRLGGDVPRRDVHPGEKRGSAVGLTKRGKGTKLAVLVERKGVPVGVVLAAASKGETSLAIPTLQQVQAAGLEEEVSRTIADRGYDSDQLRLEFAIAGVDLIVPHRKNRTRAALQDRRKLPRYRRRWIVERSFSWMQAFRRLVTRHDRLLSSYRGFVHLACVMIALRCL